MRVARAVLALIAGWTPVASAQAPGPSPAPEPNAPSEAPPVEAPVPPPQSVYVPYGLPAPGTDINAGLPSSSRPIVGDQSDTFDLNQAPQGPAVVQGNAGGQAIISAERPSPLVPDIHLVRRGDTLWDLSSHYFQNPWQWPKIWKFNPRIANPHWIYPGDQVRLRSPNDLGGAASARSVSLGTGQGGLVNRRAQVPRDSIFLRDQGFLGDPNRDVWGELVGAVEEQMLLSAGNHVYLVMRPGAQIEPGQELTVFRSIRQPQNVAGARKPPGEIVAVSGTVRVDRFDPKTRIARALIIESVDVIERGAKVGPVQRRFEVVPPRKNAKRVEARVLTSIYPHVYFAQNQLIFLDRGEKDGLEQGNTLLVLRKGDTWRRSLTTDSRMMSDRLKMESPERVDIEPTPMRGDPEKFPEEAVAELRIVRVEDKSAVAIVTQSRREVVPGDRAVARVGY
ncbi:MAG TPA: LysM domain-containing protein [Polyangiaceae bacterium]